MYTDGSAMTHTGPESLRREFAHGLPGSVPFIHVGCGYRDETGRNSALRAWLATALENDAACLLVLKSRGGESLSTYLRAGGVDVAACRDAGRLRLIDPDDVEEALETIASTEGPAYPGGLYAAIDASGDCGDPAVCVEDSLSRFRESVSGGALRILCLYDASRLSASNVADCLCRHPYIVVEGVLCENPEAEQELPLWTENREERELRRLLKGTLVHERLRRVQQERAERLPRMADRTEVGYFRANREGVLEQVNPAWLRMHGFDSLDEVVGRHFSLLPEPESCQETMDCLDRLLAGESVSSADVIRHRKDGSTGYHTISATPIVERGVVTGFEGFLIDTTRRRMAEESLRESVECYQLLANHANDLISRHAPDGTYLYASPACRRLFGCEPEDVIGRTPWQFIHAEDRSFVRRAFDQFTRDGGSIRLEYRRRCETGKYIWVETTARAIPGPSGETSEVICVARDASERKMAEQTRVELTERLQRAQKMESLSALTGGIAHDFNNLLMGILGNADLLGGGMPEGSPEGDRIQDIITSAERAADLCKQMLAFSGKGKSRVERLGMNELLQEVADRARLNLPHDVAISCELAADLPEVTADPQQIRQALKNLVSNAIESLGTGGGKVSLRSGAMECTGDYLRSVHLDENLPEGCYAYFDVEDNGCGMDEQTKARMCDPFFSTKFTGRGLGLGVVLGIVQGHLGAFKVDSSPNEGTTIRVLLPAAERRSVPRRSAPQTVEAPKGVRTVLLVDDEDIVRRVAKTMLERLGFAVLCAADGVEALELFKRYRDELAVVLMDVTMPRMNGEEAFREMHALCPTVPVILSSGYDEQEALHRNSENGLAGFIHKPYHLSALEDIIRQILGEVAHVHCT